LIPGRGGAIIAIGYGEDDSMRSFLGSVAAAIVIAIGAMFALDGAWTPADQAFTTTGVRLTNDSHNLVGKDWHSSQKF